jgi:hypothetical protein
MKSRLLIVASLAMTWLLAASAAVLSQEPRQENSPSAAAPPQPDSLIESNLTRLSKEDSVWIDTKRKLVVVDGEVAVREGFLEMFACPQGTKEHESVVAVYSKAYVVHTGLLAVGAVPGKPVQFDPEYRRAEGPIVDIYILWRDAKGEKHSVKAQEWVRNTKTQKEMEQDWVFAGSGFWTDEETGKKLYYAEQGDLICVSNFATAMLDVPIESSQSADQLLFEAFTERLPPKGTKVRLVLIPRQAKKAPGQNGEAKPDAEKNESQ